jgi:hypothetical protein
LNAQVVYQVAKALPKEEQKLLFEMLQKEFRLNIHNVKKLNTHILTKEDAIQYLLKNVFNKK